jgi:gliding motility-associated-like protein
VIGTDSAGCSDTTQITVVVNTPLVLNGISQMDCSGSCSGSATVNIVSGNGPFTYWWVPFSPPAATASSLCPGNYSCEVTGAGGCTATVSFVIVQSPSLSAAPSQTNVLCNGGNSGSATMTVSGGSPGYAYAWSSGGTSITENNLSAGTYTCTATDNAGCTITQTFSITEPPALTSILSSSPQCGADNGIAEVMVSGGTPVYTYAWSPSGATTAQATGLTSGTYTCTVTDANGCSQTQSVSVVADPLPVISISSDTTISPGESVLLTSSGGINYLWNPPGGLSCTNCQAPAANPMQTTQFCVQVTGANGCSDTDCVVVTVFSDCGDIFIPNAFSPNNDYANDQLCVRGSECIMYMQFAVFDRWGEKVFESRDPDICWDGMLRGQPAVVGVYVYYLDATLLNGHQVHLQGNVSLIR